MEASTRMGDEAAHRVVVASGNRGKLAEIRAALSFPGWEFVTAEDLGVERLDLVEDGETFTDNALIKAYAYRERFRMPALADDSGLVVDALNGEPGIRSARYAGERATNAENNAQLLRGLAGVPLTERTARFQCALVYVDERRMPTVAYGSCEGRIGLAPKGDGGFGYDPLFLPGAAPGLTMAELPMSLKNEISHRGKAIRALRETLLGAE
jgi:XTP/dITP diphosphohydrolase